MNKMVRRVQRRLQRLRAHTRTNFHLAGVTEHEETAPPIFVIGCQRSGTSLLRRVLDSHPSIACPPESKFILPTQELLDHPQALEGLSSMGFSRAMVMDRLRAFVASFFEDYAAAAGKHRWADKTPNYVDCLQFLEELFAGDALYVVIVRHPFDVCLSFEHAANKSGRVMHAVQPYVDQAGEVRAGACRFWNEQTLKIAAFVPQVSRRVVSLDYELLTSHPKPVLKQMFARLNEPWSPEVLDYSRFHHDYGFEDRKIEHKPEIVPNSGKFDSWPREERLRLAAMAREGMETWGYIPHQPHRQQAIVELENTFVQVDRG